MSTSQEHAERLSGYIRDDAPKWRTITAEQYMQGGDASGDFDEVYMIDPDTGSRREVWDVGCWLDADDKVHIYTACADAHRVAPDYQLFVR